MSTRPSRKELPRCWPGAEDPALFLNQRGSRLSVKGAHDIITAIAVARVASTTSSPHLERLVAEVSAMRSSAHRRWLGVDPSAA